MLDLVSSGRADFGTGESSSEAELGGFMIDPDEKRAMWEEGLRVAVRCMTETPFTGHSGEYVTMPPRNVVPEAAPEAAPAAVGRVQPPRHDPPRRAERHRRARVRVRRSRRGEALGRRLLRRRSRREGVPIGDAVNPNVACVTTFMCHDDEDEAMRARARRRELLRLLARALLRVRPPPARRAPTCGTSTSSAAREHGYDPEAVAAAARERRPARREGRARRASAACAARSARPTRSASTCGGTRSAASTR